ncbi:ferrous iron transporter FeoB [Lentimicrobium saccharophilum]|uniref:Ferrous iron transport protein B n=1 Tax=Lentimicrobium saccharophilum TaxID=1678841 RepID=A0A0S7C0K2_9BACT|nr:ferrous iron transport protein B [Lentimicrobium saccharophilum]GAP44279.1 ferrous iron transporter FeoB [Lentimicrobium saccharophilum]
MTLADLSPGEKGVITKVKGHGAFRKRILEMGFISGKQVGVIQRAPLMDPVEYNVMGYNVTLRNSEARLIEILTEQEAFEGHKLPSNGSMEGDLINTARKQGKIINVALVGNPNSGKTTLFNYASGSRERVGNYSGVTVDAKEARFRKGDYTFIVTDLPGTYSISAYSPEELYVRDHITESFPDVVVNIIDSSNLERNLYLTTQLIDMDIRMVGVLNMYDELEKGGNKLDYNQLGRLLGIPFVPTVGSKGKGIDELFQKIIDVYEDRDKTRRHIHINYGTVIEPGISHIQSKLRQPGNFHLLDKVSSRFIAIKLIEKDRATEVLTEQLGNFGEIIEAVDQQITRIENELKQDTESLIADAKYGFIAGALRETFSANPVVQRKKSEVVDTIITHKVWGIPIFIFLMYLTFYGTFKLGQYPMEWIESLVEVTSSWLESGLPDGMLKDLFIQGIVGGVGGVIIFLPNILLLYLFISLMEDTGYMARAVFIMDKIMHRIGLHGKSFIPLLMGFGCNVPAILSTRIIESRRDRLITMLINPFMSCSARLPVYILFISAFFVSHQGAILFSMYTIGVLLAIGSALLFKKAIFKQPDMPFVMELPPYRTPTLRTILKHMWSRAEQYLRKIGGVILVASIIIWALGYFPRETAEDYRYDNRISTIRDQYSKQILQTQHPEEVIARLKAEEETEVNQVLNEKESHRQLNSYIGRLGHFIEPVMRPLGFDWKMSVALLTGVAAKEITVGTLGVLYQAGDDTDEHSASLITKIQQQTYHDGPRKGEKVFTPLVAFSFMLFILIYFPCVAVVAAIKKESGNWRWALFIVVYTTTLAYLASLAVFQIGSLLL